MTAMLYVLLGVLIVIVAFRRLLSRRQLDGLILFNVAYFVLFVFVPLNVINIGQDAVRQTYTYERWGHGDELTALALIGCYICFVAGYMFNRPADVRRRFLANGGQSVSVIAPRLVLLFLVVGAFGLSYTTFLMGGPYDVWLHAPAVRAGQFDLKGNWVFLRQFGAFWVTAFMLYWAAHDDGFAASEKFRRFEVLLFVFMLSGVVYYALSTAGRREFMYPAMICLLVSFAARRRIVSKRSLLLVTAFLVWWLLSLLQWKMGPESVVTGSLRSHVTIFVNQTYIRVIQGLADTFMHFVGAQHASLWQFGFLRDLVELPLQFLPSRLLGFERGPGMYGDTTAFYLGHPPLNGYGSLEPTGLPGYLLVNFGYLGMLAIFGFLGAGLRWLDAVLQPSDRERAVSWLVYLWVLWMAMEWMRDGALVFVLKGRLSWWIAIGALIFSARHFRGNASNSAVGARLQS